MADAIARADRQAGVDTADAHGSWLREQLKEPLPHLSVFDALLLRTMARMLSSSFHSVSGVSHIAPGRGPFILVANHSTRREALVLPAVLMLARGGEKVHFLGDWNFRLIPGMGLLCRRAGVIAITRKPAKPRILNVLKPLFTHADTPAKRALAVLKEGGAIGLFPEGTVNRDPRALLRGRLGAARLSLESGVPVVPVGLTFPQVDAGRPVPEGSPIAINIGRPLQPGAHVPLKQWHAAIMSAISVQCGKSWNSKPEDMR